MLLLLLSLFILAAATVFTVGMFWDRGGARLRQLKQRLELVEQARKRQPRLELDLIRDDLLSEIPALNRLLGKVGSASSLRIWLRQAEIAMRPGKYLLLCAMAGAVAGLVATLTYPAATLFAMAGGAVLPAAYVSWRRSRRLARFQAQFPEAIELLVRASRAGHPPSAALELIGNEMAEPLAGEFRQLYDQQRFGLPLRDCLLNLAERVPLVDVQFFATAMIVQRESGGNLAEILEKLSHVIRERFRIARQVKVHTAQGRLTLILLMSLPPGLLVVLHVIDPVFVAPMFHDSMGHVLLGVAAGMQLTGLVILRRIMRIEV